jgi:SAM-dependent methyltransferase
VRTDPPPEWPAIVERIDRGAAAAIREDMRARGIGALDIVRGFNELYQLRGGVEPDYEATGTATAYGLQYLVQRAASIAAVLAPRVRASVPCRILDLGAGSGAALLALEALETGAVEITCVEPSSEMRAFPLMRPRTGVTVVAGTHDRAASGALEIAGTFDIVLLSACFPYSWQGRPVRLQAIQFALDVRRFLNPGGVVLGIEPAAKSAVATACSAGFQMADYEVEEFVLGGPAFQMEARAIGGLLAEFAPALRESPNFTARTAAALGPPWVVSTGAKQPDIGYAAHLLPLGARKPARPRPAVQQPKAAPRVAAPTPHVKQRSPEQKRDSFPSLLVAAATLGAAVGLGALAWWLAG